MKPIVTGTPQQIYFVCLFVCLFILQIGVQFLSCPAAAVLSLSSDLNYL